MTKNKNFQLNKLNCLMIFKVLNNGKAVLVQFLGEYHEINDNNTNYK